MTWDQRRYIAREAAIGVAINGALSALFAWLVFAGTTPAPVEAVARDAFPQSFMIALMTTVVPTLLTHRRLRAGAVAPLAAVPMLPRALLVRAALVAMTAAFLTGGAHVLLLPRLAGPFWPLLPLLAYKIVYGGLLALLIGPFILREALVDGTSVSPSNRMSRLQ
ncbi:hypothetical protein [Sphingosinicella sp. BN140058]|uniref:hypothetical protein n=1 Tax=Sphingosinicella sp. BN140058 TaxID=1892855 RepID=UPI001011DB00|nr:hypothetical protein [Sphingosinicella sp. BN140058]QAY78117.1 hypothetical protein ETR14_17490 [Sphingosinicella sp. BN140058]